MMMMMMMMMAIAMAMAIATTMTITCAINPSRRASHHIDPTAEAPTTDQASSQPLSMDPMRSMSYPSPYVSICIHLLLTTTRGPRRRSDRLRKDVGASSQRGCGERLGQQRCRLESVQIALPQERGHGQQQRQQDRVSGAQGQKQRQRQVMPVQKSQAWALNNHDCAKLTTSASPLTYSNIYIYLPWRQRIACIAIAASAGLRRRGRRERERGRGRSLIALRPTLDHDMAGCL